MAEGISQEERQRRLDNIQDQLLKEIDTHHQIYGTGHIANPFSREAYFTDPDDSKPTPEKGTKQGGELMIDANGNKAYVYADGTIEEVK